MKTKLEALKKSSAVLMRFFLIRLIEMKTTTTTSTKINVTTILSAKIYSEHFEIICKKFNIEDDSKAELVLNFENFNEDVDYCMCKSSKRIEELLRKGCR